MLLPFHFVVCTHSTHSTTMLRTAVKTTASTLWRRTAAPAVGAVRNLNVHEYISMEIMKTHGIQTPECHVASTAEEAAHLFTNSLNKRELLMMNIGLIWLLSRRC